MLNDYVERQTVKTMVVLHWKVTKLEENLWKKAGVGNSFIDLILLYDICLTINYLNRGTSPAAASWIF